MPSTRRSTTEPRPTARSRETLERLLERRLTPGADTEAIDAQIWELFGERRCVLFTDMSGFSRKAHRAGIVPFLQLIHLMRTMVDPIFEAHGGFVLKDIADSQLVLFRDPRRALAACLAAQRALARHNDAAVEPDRIYLGCGLGYGDVLLLGDHDVYGVEVNFAAKLGEDLAGPYDIFLTPAMLEAVRGAAGVSFARVPGGRLGGTKLGYFRVKYALRSEEAERKRAQKQRVRFR
jgi:class 3 adenylate cyclase